MKILVVNLLRLGDIIASTPVLKGIQAKYPGADLDLLINSQFKMVSPLLKDVHKVHLFPRNNLQGGLVDADQSLLGPYDELSNFIDQVNQENYDLVINLTHNKLSGWICSLLEAKRHEGLCFFNPNKPYFGSSWFRYLNDFAHERSETPFHYTDIFKSALSLDFKDCEFDLIFDKAAQVKDQIVFQVLTSDHKKNWGLESYKNLIQTFISECENTNMVILAAPSEKEALSSWLATFEDQSRIELYVCSLSDALYKISESRMLVTGDTSIKHLACATETQILEISLGSSQFKRTGAYREGAVIVHPKTECWPCQHSDDCIKNSHECAEDIEVQAVVDVGLSLLSNTSFNFEVKGMEVVQVKFCALGYWDYEVLGQSYRGRLNDLFEKGTWKFFLDRSYKEPMAEYGSLARLIEKSISNRQLFCKKNQKQLKFLEKSVGASNEKLKKKFEDYKKFSKKIKLQKNEVYDITQLRSDQIFLQEELERGQIKEKLIRTVNTSMMELL